MLHLNKKESCGIVLPFMSDTNSNSFLMLKINVGFTCNRISWTNTDTLYDSTLVQLTTGLKPSSSLCVFRSPYNFGETALRVFKQHNFIFDEVSKKTFFLSNDTKWTRSS